MKSFRQVLRQPIKFIAGLILMTVAAAILCICVGQALAARNTAKELDDQFTTVAVPVQKNLRTIIIDGILQDTENSVASEANYDENALRWLEETAGANPDVVKTIAKHGILSAHIPELTPLNYTQSDYIPDNFGSGYFWLYDYTPYASRGYAPTGIPYSCAMLVVTLDEIGEPVPEIRTFHKEYKAYDDFSDLQGFFEWQKTADAETAIAGYTVSLAGAVTEVVSLQEGYRDPTGMIARLSMTVPTLEALEALELEAGGKYLVYGMDYYDEDWALRGYLADDRHLYPKQIDAFDFGKLRYLTQKERYYKNEDSTVNDLVEAYNNEVVAFYDGSIELTQREVDQMNAISMTLSVPVQTLKYKAIRDESGQLLEIKVIPDITYRNRDGETVAVPMEEYTELYQIPTIARLEGCVDEFLQSEAGALWRDAIDRDEINNHAFPVIGVDKLEYLVDFAREESRITQGRDFTVEELNGGARVCIIHEQVAAASGLEVGDKITLNLYNGDAGLPYQEERLDKYGDLTPFADFYFHTTPIAETAEYTIVGTYRSPDLWTDVGENEYGLSPNTVIVPKSSVGTGLEYSNGILFNTVVLQNGKQEDFADLAAETEYRGQFTYHDQGYSDIAGNFHNYDALARQVLTVGAAVYTVILLLFLLLFPGTQGKAVMTMESLGATRANRFVHVMQSAAIVVGPATVLGGGIGMLLWQSVLDALQASAETTVALQLETSTLLLIALAQFALAMVFTAIIAAWVTAPKSLAKRRAK